MKLPIGKIRRDGGTQSRESINAATVSDYSVAMTEGPMFPPVIVYYDGADYWLADGFHRLAAAVRIGHLEFEADVRLGGRREAILHSVGANAIHGLRRTNADKRRAVETLIIDEEWSVWSDREIARRCAVDHTFVGRVRSSLATNTSEKPDPRTYTTKHGTTATMRTENIGRTRDDSEAREEEAFWEEDDDEELEGYGEAEDDEPLVYDTAIDDGVDDICRYVISILDDLESDIERHSVVNETLKRLRELSIHYNREAVR